MIGNNIRINVLVTFLSLSLSHSSLLHHSSQNSFGFLDVGEDSSITRHSNLNVHTGSLSKYSSKSEKNFLASPDKLIDDDDSNSEFKSNNLIKKLSKRLETIEGVEIASSYKEYIDLAVSDLEDRLKNSNSNMIDLKDRIQNRSKLLADIKNEILRRKKLDIYLIEKDKLLRNRLVRNTEMKSAIKNLAEIAEYKLEESASSNRHLQIGSNSDLNAIDVIKRNLNSLNESFEKRNISLSVFSTNDFISQNRKEMNNTYIQMAYSEINDLLNWDKQTLIELIRKKIANGNKLKKLENLKTNVTDALKKLKYFESHLNKIIIQDNHVKDVLKQLQDQIELNTEKVNTSSMLDQDQSKNLKLETSEMESKSESNN